MNSAERTELGKEPELSGSGMDLVFIFGEDHRDDEIRIFPTSEPIWKENLDTDCLSVLDVYRASRVPLKDAMTQIDGILPIKNDAQNWDDGGFAMLGVPFWDKKAMQTFANIMNVPVNLYVKKREQDPELVNSYTPVEKVS